MLNFRKFEFDAVIISLKDLLQHFEFEDGFLALCDKEKILRVYSDKNDSLSYIFNENKSYLDHASFYLYN